MNKFPFNNYKRKELIKERDKLERLDSKLITYEKNDYKFTGGFSYKGYLVLNISDYKLKSKVYNIVEPMREYIKNNHKDMDYLGYIGSLSISRKKGTNYFIEPIFVWKKKEQDSV